MNYVARGEGNHTTLFITSGHSHGRVYKWDLRRYGPAIDKMLKLRRAHLQHFDDTYLFVNPLHGKRFNSPTAMNKAFATYAKAHKFNCC